MFHSINLPSDGRSKRVGFTSAKDIVDAQIALPTRGNNNLPQERRRSFWEDQ